MRMPLSGDGSSMGFNFGFSGSDLNLECSIREEEGSDDKDDDEDDDSSDEHYGDNNYDSFDEDLLAGKIKLGRGGRGGANLLNNSSKLDGSSLSSSMSNSISIHSHNSNSISLNSNSNNSSSLDFDSATLGGKKNKLSFFNCSFESSTNQASMDSSLSCPALATIPPTSALEPSRPHSESPEAA